MKDRRGLQRIVFATKHSWDGLCAAVRGEAAFRQLLGLAAVMIPIAVVLDVSPVERAVMIAALLLALVVEMLNSAIEATVDRISLEFHPLSKQAKDMGSAAQMLALMMVGVVWGLILLAR